jgi:glutamine synthetase adenylyltransferase
MHAFRRHWTERAEPWERLAVARASVVSASDPEFGARVGAVLERARRLGPEARVELAATAGRMRARQRRELARETEGRWNLKVGRGSITDLEFIAALEQLCDPLQAPDRGPEPTAVLRGGLAGGIEVEPLVEAYGFFRRVEARLRLRGGKSPNGLEWGTESATRLASSLGFKDAPALRRAVSERREHVAETASRLLRGSSSLGAPSDR